MKKCIFCGKKVKDKTKEHVIPKWLIKTTGDPNRDVNIGFNYGNFLNDKKKLFQSYSINSFTFPACKECNNDFGKSLEVSAKNIIEKILNKEDVSADELIILLDWFDKVRIGLWIGYNMLNKNVTQRNKKFHINQRMGLYDRAIIVYKSVIGDGINFSGVNSPIFDATPICFTLRINDFFFFNISKDRLLLKELGFPYPSKITLFDNGISSYDSIEKGTESVSDPLQEWNIIESSKAVYQPLFKEFKDICDFDSDYVKNNSISQKEGVGNIFVRTKNGVENINKVGGSYNLTPRKEYLYPKVLSRRLAYKTLHNLEINIEKIFENDFRDKKLRKGVREYFAPFKMINNEMKKLAKKTIFKSE